MSPQDAFLHEGFRRLVRGRLRGVWLRGTIPTGRVVWAANHHSWWDPFLADVLVRAEGRSAALVMTEEGLREFGFVRRLGVVGTTEVRAATAMVRAQQVLVVFPEAEICSPGRPGPLSRGAAWFAERTDATLVAAAVRVTIRGQEAPEAYVDLRPVGLDGGSAVATERLSAVLGDALASIDAAIAGTDPRVPLAGFTEAVRGRRSWDERLARLGRRR